MKDVQKTQQSLKAAINKTLELHSANLKAKGTNDINHYSQIETYNCVQCAD